MLWVPSARITTTLSASTTERGEVVELVMLAPSRTRRTIPSAPLSTTTWPSLSEPLSRYVPAEVMVTVLPSIETPAPPLLPASLSATATSSDASQR